MKQKNSGNHAFIDNENVNISVQKLGRKVDWRKLIHRLKKDFGVTKVFMFMGYLVEYEEMYEYFRSLGYTLIFKKVLQHSVQKGNIDAELVLHTMIQYQHFNQAVILSGDGDFSCLVEYLLTNDKLRCVISPNKKRTSNLLEETTQGRFLFLDGFKRKLSYNPKKQKDKKKKEGFDTQEKFRH